MYVHHQGSKFTGLTYAVGQTKKLPARKLQFTYDIIKIVK